MIPFNFLLEILALVGIIFIITGVFMQIFPPKKINSLYGYRTNRSMQNQKKWDFAQKYAARLLTIIGLVLLIISLINSFFSIRYGASEKIINVILIIGSVIFLLIKTEKRLKNI
ncbi:SdpI family protein [Lacinutrix cladophorae]